MNINSLNSTTMFGQNFVSLNKNNFSNKNTLNNQYLTDTVSFSGRSKHASSKEKSDSTIYQMLRRFRLNIMPERFMNEYLNRDYLNNALIENYDEINSLLGKYGYKPKINMENIKYSRDHFLTTYNFAKNFTTEGGFKLSQKKRDCLLEAALLHDAGKALIPNEILTKPGKFTPEEKEIMDLHSELGWLLLKDSDLSKETLEAIRMHHRQGESRSFITKLLAYFDTLSALKEKRCYKEAKKGSEVIEIQKQIAKNGGLEKGILRRGTNIMNNPNDESKNS